MTTRPSTIDVSSVVDICLKAIAELGGLLAAIYWRYLRRITRELQDRRSLPHYRSLLEDTPPERKYRTLLEQVLAAADRFFGTNAFGMEAFSRVLFLAILYPTFFAVLGWLMDGSSGIINLLPTGWPWVLRAAFVVLSILYFLLVHEFAYHREFFRVSLGRLLVKRFPSLLQEDVWLGQALITGGVCVLCEYLLFGRIRGFALLPMFYYFGGGFGIVWASLTMWSGMVLIARVASLPVAIVFGAFAFALGSTAYTRLGSTVYKGPSLKSYTGFLTGLAGLAVFLILRNGLSANIKEGYGLVLVTLVALPLVNGIFDYLSLGITRVLGRVLLRNFSKYKAVLLGVVDLFTAVFLLVCLTAALSFTLSALDALVLRHSGQSVVHASDLLMDLVRRPRSGQGLWVALMLCSTLVPTLLHFMLAESSVVRLRPKRAERDTWIQSIDGVLAEGGGRGLPLVTCRRIANFMFWHRWFGPMIVTIVAVVVVVLSWNAWIGSLPGLLSHVAAWAMIR